MNNNQKQPSLAKVFFDRFRRPLLILIFAVIFGLGYWLVLAVPLGAYRDNLVLLNKLDRDLALADNQLATARNYSSRLYQLTPSDNKLLDSALPSQPDSASLISHLTSLAERSGFSVNNIDIDDSVQTVAAGKNNQLGKVAVRMKLKGGGYDELKQFLALTESSIMMVDVYSINFTSQTPIYDVALVVYYYNGN